MVETQSEPVTKISNPKVFYNKQNASSHFGLLDEKKKLKFAKATICKISSIDNERIDEVIACLSAAFDVSPTSAKMFNDETKQFFQFVSVAHREA